MDGEGLHRCFAAIEFPFEVVKEIERIQRELNKMAFIGKTIELDNLHLTLKFLGELDDEMLGKVREKLREVEFSSFNARLGECGTFDVMGNPRIVWSKVNGKEVFELQADIDRVLGEIGFKKEERFMSHLTIARIKYVKDKIGFREHVVNLGVGRVKFKIGEFELKESVLGRAGPVYTTVEKYGAERH